MKNLFLSFGLLVSYFTTQAQCSSLSPLTLPFSEGFESFTGEVSSDANIQCSSTYRWDYNQGGSYGRLDFEADSMMGAHAAVLRSTSYISDTSQLMLTTNMSSYAATSGPIYLSFFYKDNGDISNVPDRIWLRGSSSDSWIQILDWSTPTSNKEWFLVSFRIDSILTANSQNFSASTQVLWSRYGNGPYTVGGGLAIDEILITDGSCAKPSAFASTAIAPGSVTLNWGGTGSSWEIAYGETGEPISNNAQAASRPYTITGLTVSKSYDFYVRNTCGTANTSEWVGPLSAFIPCGAQQAPYLDDFETGPANSAPDCWVEYSNIPNPSAVLRSAGSPYSGARQLALNSSNGTATDTLYAISPLLTDLVAGDKEVSMRIAAADLPNSLIVGTTSDPSGKGAFNALDTFDFATTNTHREVFVPFTTANGYNGTDQYIVLKHSMTATYDYIYVDDFDYHVIPSCPKPLDVQLANLTSSSVDISFDDRGSSPYEYVYGTPGFAQASGTVQSATSNPFTVSGLTPMTTYELLVRNKCSATDASPWSDPIEFTTECVPFTAPYFTDFESDDQNVMPLCWDYYESFGSSRGQVDDYGTHQSGAQSLQLYNGYTYVDTLLAITPELAGVTLGDKQIRFYAQTSDAANYLVVGTMPAPGATTLFDALDTIYFSVANTYQEHIITLDALNGYNGTDTYVALMHGMGARNSYIYIDDFNYEVIPACAPTMAGNINLAYYDYDSVFVNWTPGEGLKFNVEVGPVGFTPGTGVSNVTVLDTFAGISGLAGNTAYEIYLKDSCNTGWLPAVGPISFTTTCAPVVAPFVEDFNSGSQPGCWEAYSNTSSTNALAFWKYSGSPVGGALGNGRPAGSYAWVDGSNPSGVDTLTNVTLRTPYLDVSQLNVPQLYFEVYSLNSTNVGDNVTFSINLWDGAQWNNGIFSYAGDDTDWKDFTLLFNNYTLSGPIQLEFVVDKTTSLNSSQNDFLLDSVVVKEADACPRPDHFSVSSVMGTSATFDVNAVNAGSYDIEWGPRGFQQGSGAGTSVNVTTVPYTANGLTPNKPYDAYVRVNCSTGGRSVWVGPLAFDTECNGPLAGGTYTVGKGATDDFPSLDSVASVLNNCGIAGPVVFNLQPGNFKTAFHLYSISGVSSVNTITINGSGNDTLEYNGAGAQAAVLLDDVSYVTLSGLYITNLNAAESFGVLLTNNSDSVTIDNCVIEVDASLPASDIIPVIISNSNKDYRVEGADVDYFTLKNSTLIGGHTSLALEGNGDGNPSKGYVIEGNTLENYYLYGVYADDLADVLFKDNTVTTNRFLASDGFYLSDMSDFIIEGNKVNVPDYGIYISDGNEGGTATTNSSIVNNMVISSGDNAGYLVDVENTNIFHNTFFGESGFYMDNHVAVDIRNNIFASNSTYAFQSGDALLAADTWNYNLYYVGGTQNTFRVNNVTYADLAAVQTALPTYNVNSVEGDPIFYSASDLHVLGTLANGVGDNTVGIATDIDGEARPYAGTTTVDMGADEYEPVLSDVGVVSILDPQSRNCGDSNTTVTVVIKNFGLNAVSNFDVNVDVAGDASANLSANYSQSLASQQMDTISMVGFNSIYGGEYSLKAYTALSGDQLMANDTIAMRVMLSHAGDISIFASDTAICGPSAITLWADTNFAGLPFVWSDAQGNLLGTGDSLSLATVDSTTSVTLSVDTNGLDNFNTFAAGATDTTMGAAYASSAYTSWMPKVSAYQEVVIKDAKIYPQSSGTLIVDMKDIVTGNVVTSVSVPVNQTSAYMPVRVNLNLTVPVGDYEMRVNPASTVGQMMKNDNGGNYPYGDPSVFEVTSQTFADLGALYEGYYFFFYDMTITSVAGCPRPASSFTITYGEATTAAFASTVSSVTVTNAVVDFDATTTATDANATYTWDFGDGSTGAGDVVSHTYSANGTYTVKLVVDGECESDSITHQVVIEGVSIEENVLDRSLSVFPNPTSNQLNVSFAGNVNGEATLFLSDMTGKVIMAKQYSNVNGSFEGSLDLNSLPKGTYILNVESEGLSAQRRVVKI